MKYIEFREIRGREFTVFALARDVAPLVFIPGDAKKIELFPEFVRGMG